MPLAIGVGVVGGYAVSPDTFEGVLDNEAAAVWDASIDIMSIMGVVLEENEDKGFIVAKISGTKVTATVIQVGKRSVKLSIRARKLGFPRVALAQDVFVKISNHLNR